jgi:hypothetical protein
MSSGPGGPAAPGRLPVDLRPRRSILLPYNDLLIDAGLDQFLPIDPKGFSLTLGMVYGLGPNEPRVLRTDDNGNLLIQSTGPAGTDGLRIALNGDGASNLGSPLLFGDGNNGGHILAVDLYGSNGGTYDRLRLAQALDAGAQTGILATFIGRLFNNGTGTGGSLLDYAMLQWRAVSGLNAQQQQVIELRNLASRLSIVSVASGGTATLQVEVSTDNVNFISIDTLAAALTQAKDYSAATVGATVAVSPLAFRYVRITAGAAGVGNTTTLTVGAK